MVYSNLCNAIKYQIHPISVFMSIRKKKTLMATPQVRRLQPCSWHRNSINMNSPSMVVMSKGVFGILWRYKG